ncbi:MAG: response regulator [Pseudomonadota bacterium]
MAAVEADEAHLLVVDDDDRIRALLKRYLGEQGYRVTVAADAAEARAAMISLQFDCLILDVMMPGETGFELTAALRRSSNVPILLLTARDLPEDRIEGFELGADDYLSKPFEPRELLLRIAALLRRAGPAPEPRGDLTFGECVFNQDRGELHRAGAPVRVTSGELALLRALATQPGVPVSRMDLTKRTSATMERSVDVQVTRLRKKIETDPKNPVYLQTVRGVGYVLLPD